MGQDGAESRTARATCGAVWRLAGLQPIRFVLVGVLNTLFGYSAFAVLLLLGIHYTVAVAVATAVGVLFNFVTTGRMVFDSRDPGRLLLFVPVYLVVYLLNVGGLRLAVRAGVDLYVANALLLPGLAVLSFFLNKQLVFKKQ